MEKTSAFLTRRFSAHRFDASSTRRRRGQAALWFLATLAACCATFALVYNVGQITNEKQKVINASDAAAFSGALVEARVLNFEAYTNRAMIANEVLIAQLLSLDSWVRYSDRLATNISYATSWVPWLNAVTAEIANVTEIIKDVVDKAVEIGVPAIDKVITVALRGARDLAHVGAVAAAQEAAGKVAADNKTVFGGRYDATPGLMKGGGLDALSFVRNEAVWLGFTKDYGSGDQRQYARAVMLESRDQFSSKRGAGWLEKSVSTAMQIGSLGTTGMDKTSGETKLRGYDRWEAQDSLDVWAKPPGGKKKYIVPIAWGRDTAANTSTSGTNWTSEYDCGGKKKPPCPPSFTLAYNEQNKITGWSGVPSIRDLKDRNPANRDKQTIDFLVAVSKSADGALTTQKLGIADKPITGKQGSPDLQDNMLKNQFASLSSARIFFERPKWNAKDITQGNLPRDDRVKEYASLYNPYWQVRLQPTSIVEKEAVYVLLGAPAVAGLVSP